MQELFTWLAAAIFTVTVFFSGFTAKTSCIKKRSTKQDMNLAGKMLSSYCSVSDTIEIDDEKYTAKLRSLLGNEDFCGTVFLYPKQVVGINTSGTRYEEDIPSNKIGNSGYLKIAASRMAGKIAGYDDGSEGKIMIEASKSGEGLYNRIECDGVTVFLVTKDDSFVAVSGFTVTKE